MKQIIFILLAAVALSVSAQIGHTTLLRPEEMKVNPNDIIQLHGIGLCLQCGPDSLMVLDNPELGAVHWVEPNLARDYVVAAGAVYAAEGDSIYRVATELQQSKFLARMDNEQFMLYSANAEEFFAVTSDEDFSCVYRINPVQNTCIPEMSIQAPIQKISSYNGRSVMWIDDQIFLMDVDNDKYTYIFSWPTISDMVLTPMGLMIATADGIYWVTDVDGGAILYPKSVSRVWWDDDDILYVYLPDGTIEAFLGIRDTYMKVQAEHSK